MGEKRELFSRYFMYFVIVLWFGSEILINTTIKQFFLWNKEDVNTTITYLVFAFLFIQILFFQRYSLDEVVGIGVVTIPIILGTMASGDHLMMATWMFIVASRYIDFDTVAKFSYFLLLALVPLVIYLYFEGYIDEKTMMRGSMVRHSWGFTHPNWLGVRIFQMVALRTYIRRKKISYFDYIIIFFAALFIKRITDCQTAFFSMIILLLFLTIYWIMGCFVEGNNFFANMMICLGVISNVASVALSIIDVKKFSFLNKVDIIMSRRFALCHRAMKYFGITLFGNNVNLYSTYMRNTYRRFYIDTAYVAIILRYGLVVYLMFSFLLIATMIKCKRDGNYFLLMMLCLYSVYGIMENTLYALNQNMFLLALSYPLYHKKILEYGTSKQINTKKKILISI